MFSNLILGLVELVHEDEKIVDRMQENKCRGVYIDKYTWWGLLIFKIYMCINKCIYEKNEREWIKRKEWWGKKEEKRHDRMLKVKIGGYKYKWRSVAPLV